MVPVKKLFTHAFGTNRAYTISIGLVLDFTSSFLIICQWILDYKKKDYFIKLDSLSMCHSFMHNIYLINNYDFMEENSMSMYLITLLLYYSLVFIRFLPCKTKLERIPAELCSVIKN